MKLGMRTLAGLGIAAAMLFASGCTMMAPPAPKEQYGSSMDSDVDSDQNLVREQIFRSLLRDHPKEQWVFLSYGQGESGNWSNPTRALVDKLKDLNLKLAPASMGNVPRSGAVSVVVHAKTGEPGILYSAKILKWLDDDIAVVEGTRYKGTTPKSGFSGTVKRSPDGTWHIDQFKPW